MHTYICFPTTEPSTAVVTGTTTTVTVTTNCTGSKGSSTQKGLSAAVIILTLIAFVTTAMTICVGVVLCRRHARANAVRVYTGEQP